MARRTTADWEAVVFSHPNVSAPCKLTLIFLARHMKASGEVSVPRAEIAAQLATSERPIDRHIAEARQNGLLDVVAAGRRGRTAVYKRLFPSGVSAPDIARFPPSRYPEDDSHKWRANENGDPQDHADLQQIARQKWRTTTTYVGETSSTDLTQSTPQLTQQQWNDCYRYISEIKGKTSPRAWMRSLPPDVQADTIRDFLDHQQAQKNKSNYTDRNRGNLAVAARLAGTDKQMLILQREMTSAIAADAALEISS